MCETILTESPAHAGLTAVLAAKEQRHARQQALLARYGQTVISLTLVTPGPVKDTPLYRQAMIQALSELDDLCRARGWTVSEQQLHWLATGAEALWVVEKDALSVKAALIAVEEQHPLGRLWDFDVLGPQTGVVSRILLAHGPRRCLLCDEAAHACSRSRRHPLPEVLAAIEERLHGWFDGR
ncbi:citrate lyase holo-[acyl-carrier protein] synthase [Dickeya lacustris]|uniref:Apo-citrate lyase phosphoribosyl-dephospho-CoA transferase n=2 Tax=Dickeya lacustris TaxID=2259638 RepID=A0ABY8G7H9_9GAMM|nr:citrate lyase holo-[acyl-carrier protein] synthase [Dickeya lacustris]WFN55922.1 citrate lyase holo-[acyl-carrier protein] synthase [Dickeya lacustris]